MDKKIFVAFVTALSGLNAQARTSATFTQVNDTIARDLSDLEAMLKDSVVAEAVDTTYYGVARQRNFNALKFVLDGRHRFKGDNFKNKNFWDHTFVEFGAGTGGYRSANQYKFTPQTNLHFYLGREFSPMSSIRLGVGGGMTYLKKNKNLDISNSNALWDLHASIDYLFNFSNYICGYRPDRALQVSGALGLGYGVTHFENYSGPQFLELADLDGHYLNARAGLQFKFFAGSKSSLTIEPYVKMGTDKMDLSKIDRHDAVDFTYGVDLSYIYYFNSVLSDYSGDLKRTYGEGERYLSDDPTLASRRAPFFLDYSFGTSRFKGMNLDMSKTGGYNVSANIGKWLSSAIGVRAGLTGSNNDWFQYKTRIGRITKGGITLDALINPFGFHRGYNWDSQFGVNFFAGYEYGRMRLTNTRNEEVNKGKYIGYRGGVQIWTKLTDDLRLTIEPTLTEEENYVGRAHGRVRYDELAVKAGLTVLFRDHKQRVQEDSTDVDNLLSKVYFGAGLGWNSSIYRWRYDNFNRGLIKNGMAFLGYHFNETHGARLMYENTVDKFLTDWDSKDQNQDVHTTTSNLLSLDYEIDLLNAMAGVRPSRRWGVNVYLGPTFAFGGSDKDVFGLNVGGQLSYRVSRNTRLFFSHTAYWLKNRYYNEQYQVHYLYGTLINSLNVGFVYNFNSFKKEDGYGFDGGGHPFFVEYGVGVNEFPNLPSKASESWGTAVRGGLGMWFTPFLGARVSANFNKGIAVSSDVQTLDGTQHKLSRSIGTGTGTVDLLINPFGFGQNYSYDQPFGMNIVFGYQNGYFALGNVDKLVRGTKLWLGGLHTGAQFWAKISDNLRFYVEPEFSAFKNSDIYYNEEKQEFSKTRRGGYKSFDIGNNFGVKAGLSLTLTPVKKREIPDEDLFSEPNAFVGIGGGINDPIRRNHFEGKNSNLNGIILGGYRFSPCSSFRGSVEFLNNSTTNAAMTTVKRVKGLQYRESNTTVGILSLDYQLDILSWFAGYRASRKFDASIFFGISGAMNLSNTLKKEDGTEIKRRNLTKTALGGNMGMMLEYKFTKDWEAFFNHNMYGFAKGQQVFNSDNIVKNVTAFNTFNIGIIRNF